MKIQNHKLVKESNDPDILFKETPNQSSSTITPQYIIMHYTAGNSFQSSVEWLLNPDSKASAHIIIGRNGEIIQLGKFNKKLWHAGTSRWADLIGMNNYSIGIELDNSGRLKKSGSKWINVSGRVIPDTEVVLTKHKHEDTEYAWQTYTPIQIERAQQICVLLKNTYTIKDILGHEDIAPFRKADPGPAFNMNSFASAVLGRQDDSGEIYKVNVDNANFRSTPEQLPDNIIAKLKKDTKVEYINALNGWFRVYIASANSSIKEKIGWVHSSILKKHN